VELAPSTLLIGQTTSRSADTQRPPSGLERPPQGDRSSLIILYLGPGPAARRPVRQGWSQVRGLVSPRYRASQPAPPRRCVHPVSPRSAHLGSTPLVQSLGEGRIADAVRQER